MKQAFDEAMRGMDHGDGGPFGAVIVYKDEVIATAHNEVLASNDPTAHAEINAIRTASQELGRFDLSGCTLYTTCKPCPMCLGAIMWARISTLYYVSDEEDARRGGFDDQKFYKALGGEEALINMHRINTESASLLFERWLAKEDRQGY